MSKVIIWWFSEVWSKEMVWHKDRRLTELTDFKALQESFDPADSKYKFHFRKSYKGHMLFNIAHHKVIYWLTATSGRYYLQQYVTKVCQSSLLSYPTCLNISVAYFVVIRKWLLMVGDCSYYTTVFLGKNFFLAFSFFLSLSSFLLGVTSAVWLLWLTDLHLWDTWLPMFPIFSLLLYQLLMKTVL